MIVTDHLYRSPQHYRPGHIFLRKSAIVNSHFLAFICLKTVLNLDAVMAGPDDDGQIELVNDEQHTYLWQCLLFSDHEILDQQRNAFTRFLDYKDDVEHGFAESKFYPWAALTRIQAPKFLGDMIESLLGAVYLDSGGNIEVARQVLCKLGIHQILEKIVSDGMDVLHPVSRLSLFAQKNGKTVEYKFQQTKGKIVCDVVRPSCLFQPTMDQ